MAKAALRKIPFFSCAASENQTPKLRARDNALGEIKRTVALLPRPPKAHYSKIGALS